MENPAEHFSTGLYSPVQLQVLISQYTLTMINMIMYLLSNISIFLFAKKKYLFAKINFLVILNPIVKIQICYINDFK